MMPRKTRVHVGALMFAGLMLAPGWTPIAEGQPLSRVYGSVRLQLNPNARVPWQGVLVKLDSPGWFSDDPQRFTDGNGEYSFNDVAPGDYDLVVETPAGQRNRVRLSVRAGTGHENSFEFPTVRDYVSAFRNGIVTLELYGARKAPVAVGSFREAIAVEQATAVRPVEEVRLYGMWTYKYTPRYFLRRALLTIPDCQALLRNFTDIETTITPAARDEQTAALVALRPRCPVLDIAELLAPTETVGTANVATLSDEPSDQLLQQIDPFDRLTEMIGPESRPHERGSQNQGEPAMLEQNPMASKRVEGPEQRRPE
jgi:hypothetical protein